MKEFLFLEKGDYNFSGRDSLFDKFILRQNMCGLLILGTQFCSFFGKKTTLSETVKRLEKGKYFKINHILKTRRALIHNFTNILSMSAIHGRGHFLHTSYKIDNKQFKWRNRKARESSQHYSLLFYYFSTLTIYYHFYKTIAEK